MAHSDRNQKKERIAIANVKNIGAIDVCYVGGSTFELEFKNNGDQKPVRFNITALEKLIHDGQATITNQDRFKKIKASILPDGSTKTHNADGSIKSTTDKAMEMLIQDGHVEIGKNGVPRNIDPKERELREKQRAKEEAQKKAEQRRREQEKLDSESELINKPHTAVPERRTNQARFSSETQSGVVPMRPSSRGAQELRERLSDVEDIDFQEPEIIENTDDSVSEHDSQKRSRRNRRQEPAGPVDLNGDGVIDEFDEFISEEQKKNWIVMVLLFVSCILSIVLFFFGHGVTAMIFHGEAFDIVPDVIVVNQDGSGTPTASDGTSDIQASQTGTKQQGDEGSDTLPITIRTDFDPETAVKDLDIADDEHKKVGIVIMQTIRQYYLDGDVKSLTEDVNLEHIAGQISEAYSKEARKRQSLSLPASEELRKSYKEYLSKCERQHVVDKDPYASIFGGRIREIRQEGDSKIYIVMEAISGDHQRICLKAKKDSKDAWTVTSIMDPEGYASMICDGEQD